MLRISCCSGYTQLKTNSSGIIKYIPPSCLKIYLWGESTWPAIHSRTTITHCSGQQTASHCAIYLPSQ